jgi:hypothetical protein
MGVDLRCVTGLLVLMLTIGASRAAEPVAPAAATPRPQAEAAATRTRPVDSPTPTVRLDLTLGDMSRYFSAEQLAASRDESLEEIVVNGRRPEDLPDRRAVPMGVFPALFYAATRPLDAWRIVAPVPNFHIPDRTVDDPKDPPGSYRGRILEPGAIYD